MQKSKLYFRFIFIVVRHFRAFLKNLLHFTNENYYRDRVLKHKNFKNGLPVVNILDLTPELCEKIISYTYLEGTSRAIDIAVLKALAKKFNGCDYFEIGSFRGESIVNIAEHCNDCISLSLSEAEMRQFGFSEKSIKLDGLFFKSNKKINRFAQNSMTFDFSSMNKKFDLIFVDGDHAYEAVKSDTRNVLPLLKNENSLIVWHDCGISYEDMRWEVIAGILDGLPESEHKNVYRVSNTLLGIYSRSKLKTFSSLEHVYPDKLFSVTIEGKPVK